MAADEHNGPGRATIRSIAQATGYSVATVSRALNGSPSVRPETIREVQNAADRLGYRRSAVAAGLRTGRTGILCLVLHIYRKGDFSLDVGSLHLIAGIHDRLEGTGYTLTLVPFRNGDNPADIMEGVVRQGLGDGVIFAATEPEDERVKLLRARDIPFVTFGRTELAVPHPYYDVDNLDYAYRATKELIERGVKRPVLITPSVTHMYGWHRRVGFMRALKEFGLSFDEEASIIVERDNKETERRVLELLQGANPPDGFVCDDDLRTMPFINFLKRQGLVPGQTVQIAVIENIRLLEFVGEPVIVFQQDLHRAGYMLADFLVRRLEGADVRNLMLVETMALATPKV